MTDENTELASMPELVIVSGMSGAGRTEAMHSFEDLGYFCVDNLPSSLIGNLLELTGMPGQPDEHRRLAVVCDARNRDFCANLTAELAKLKGQGIGYRILFLDAADEKLDVYKRQAQAQPGTAPHGISAAAGRRARVQPVRGACARGGRRPVQAHEGAPAARPDRALPLVLRRPAGIGGARRRALGKRL